MTFSSAGYTFIERQKDMDPAVKPVTIPPPLFGCQLGPALSRSHRPKILKLNESLNYEFDRTIARSASRVPAKFR